MPWQRVADLDDIGAFFRFESAVKTRSKPARLRENVLDFSYSNVFLCECVCFYLPRYSCSELDEVHWAGSGFVSPKLLASWPAPAHQHRAFTAPRFCQGQCWAPRRVKCRAGVNAKRERPRCERSPPRTALAAGAVPRGERSHARSTMEAPLSPRIALPMLPLGAQGTELGGGAARRGGAAAEPDATLGVDVEPIARRAERAGRRLPRARDRARRLVSAIATTASRDPPASIPDAPGAGRAGFESPQAAPLGGQRDCDRDHGRDGSHQLLAAKGPADGRRCRCRRRPRCCWACVALLPVLIYGGFVFFAHLVPHRGVLRWAEQGARVAPPAGRFPAPCGRGSV